MSKALFSFFFVSILLVGCFPFGATPPSCAVSSDTPEQTLTGTWQGKMLQPGGPYESYIAVMWLAQDGKNVTGVTRVWTPDGRLFGDIRLEGCTSGNELRFADVELLDDNLPPWLGWCDKTASLSIDAHADRLTGAWHAGGCAPGTFDLHRVADHPRVILPGR
ncbi:MAG TPA: hypothetical protein VIF62_32160 [Labilithrix sp.]|jgi:hypothetical protein